MEDEVDATVLLNNVSPVICVIENLLTVAARAMHLEASTPEPAALVVIMPNLLFEMKEVRSWIFSSTPGSSWFFALYLLHALAIVG